MNIRFVLQKEIRLLRQMKKMWIFLLIFLNAVCKGLQPFVMLQLPRFVLTMLEEQRPTEHIIPVVIGFCMLSLMLFGVAQWCGAVFHAEFNALRQQGLLELNELYQSTDYENIESAEFQNETRSARRAVSNPTGIEGVCSHFANLCPAVLTLCAYIAFFLRAQPLIAICCVVCTSGAIAVNGRIAHAVKESEKTFSRLEKQEDAFLGISHSPGYGKDIRLFSLAQNLKDEFWKISEENIQENRRLMGKEFRLGAVSAGFVFVRDFLCYALIAQGYFQKALSIGDVTLCGGMILSLSTVLEEAAQTMTEWVKSLANAEKYFEFMEQYSHQEHVGSRPPISTEEALRVEFRDVSFWYPGSESWILRHFNLTLEQGETLALVGANGTGKSTLVKLLTGLFRPVEGEILLNGIPVETFDPARYREMFAAVYQEPILYAMSVLENVIGTDTGEEARQRGIDCLDAVGLKEKIDSLPLGCDTPLLRVFDENGVELSGGQAQRVAIARALYKHAGMVLLDEPTAALDARAEGEIYEAFHRLAVGKTSIYVSHRLSSTSFCDHILLFTPSGEIEYGTHSDLMEKRGEYYRMFQTQGKYYRNKQEEE